MFTTYPFLIFLLASFLIFFMIPAKWRNTFLVIDSYIFYFTVDAFYPLFLLTTTITIFITALKIDHMSHTQEVYLSEHKSEMTKEERKEYNSKSKGKKKRWLMVAMLLNLGILAALKYCNFFIENINDIFSTFHVQKEIEYLEIFLPLGISFYTFQAVGYLLDVYWKKCGAQKNFVKFALFTSFFPQLGQGPISRYGELSKTLYEEHYFDFIRVRFGLERIMWGYFKKLVVADRIYPAVAMITSDPEYYTGGFVFAGMLFYAVQLYADFTGGIDITIGIAQVFGIRIRENFERPFFSKSIAEYWRRWHISMGTWFRDYVFYPLSISRPMKKLTTFTKKHFGLGAGKRVSIYTATIIVWFATGLWHGASWNFIMWGVSNGIVILISQELEPLYKKFHNRFPYLQEKTWYRGFQVIRTFLLLSCLRLYDNYIGVGTAFEAFISMFKDFNLAELTKAEFLDMGLTSTDYIIVLAGVLIMLVVSLIQRGRSVREYIAKMPFPVKYVLFVGLFFTIVLLGCYGLGYDSSGFIYTAY